MFTHTWEEAVRWLREQPDQQDLVRFCYYDDPLEGTAERYRTSEEWQAVQHLLNPVIGTNVLDLGAGRGISSYAFAKSGCKVTALEPDPSALVGAKAIRDLFAKAGLPVSIVEEKGEHLPFPDNTFDIVYGRAVFHHALDIGIFCREAHRVLKSGGVFLMTREHVISRAEDLKAFLDAHPLHRFYGGEHAYMLDEYINALRAAGLRNLSVIGPFESAINYAPMTTEEFHRMIVRSYSRFVGRRLARLMADVSSFREWNGKRLSRKSNEPGRLYTFKALKH